MLARGFSGKFHLVTHLKMELKDYAFAISLLLIAVMIYFTPLFAPFTVVGGWF